MLKACYTIKMRTMKKYICQIVFAGLLLSAASCDKSKLNPTSTTAIPYDVKFSSKDRIGNLVNGLYSGLKNGNLLGGRGLIYNDVRADNFLNQTNNGVTALLIWNFTVTGSDAEINNTWNAAYATIDLVNIFLDGMQQKGNAVVGDSLAKQYGGEAKFVRALAYYTLLQLYCQPYSNGAGSKPGLPIRLLPITTAGFNDLARSTVADTYKQILADLNDAAAAVPATYSTPALNTTRAHVNTVAALKTRVYLNMGDWANVITEGNKIVSAGAPFKAPTGVANALQSDVKLVFSNYTTTESIMSMPFTGANEAPGTQNSLASYYLAGTQGGSGEFSLNLKGIVSDSVNWPLTDARRSFVSDPVKGLYYFSKFKVGSPYTDWVPVMRYAEVLLNLAEALVRSTNTVDARAVDLLNAVHRRSDASTTYTVGGFGASTDLITAILRERNIEFLAEGLRAVDITRLGLPFPAKGSVSALAPGDPAYIFPAPTSETQYNHLW
jgi:hypothetical protein